MSGTRLPSQKEPVTEALLVSHGQPSQPRAGEEHVKALADQVGLHLPNWSVRSATLAAPDALERALDICRRDPLVFPVFMTDGWFTKTALPKRLAQSATRQLPPLGTLPDLPELAARLLRKSIERRNWSPDECEILIAGHGSATGPDAARRTNQFAAALGRFLPVTAIRVGFLEQAPYLSDVAARCRRKTVELPFFAAPGGHVCEDVPQALNMAGFNGVRLPCLGQARGIPELIARTLKNAAKRHEAA